MFLNRGTSVSLFKTNPVKKLSEKLGFKIYEETEFHYKMSCRNVIKNEYNEMPVIINENKELIKLLNLTPYNDISNEHNKNKGIKNTDMINNSSINAENSKIYCKKLIEDKIRHNNTVSNFYKNKNQRL